MHVQGGHFYLECQTSTDIMTTSPQKIKYEMLDELEHILTRPDTFVGSVDLQTLDHALVFDSAQQEFVCRESIVWCPALCKLCDELLVNVADHKTRYPGLVKKCKVSIDVDTGEFKIWNDGPGIDVEIHEDWGVYKVQGIFGNLRSSSNFNDEETRYTGGRNGYGAKLANVFATRFTVETCDGIKRYKQTWTTNMSTVGKPSIRTPASAKPKPFTQITFVPDWTRFGSGVDQWTPDMLLWISSRCVELSGTKPKLEVTFQGTKLPVKGFRSYSKAIGRALVPEYTMAVCTVNKRWEVGLAASPGAQSVVRAYVNSIATPKGGTHVRHVRNQLVKYIKTQLKKKYTRLRPSNAMVESNLMLMINAMIPNPKFGSQTKEELTSPASKFGVKCAFTDAQLAKLVREANVVDILAERAKGTVYETSKFTDAKKAKVVHVDKLDDAVWAGGTKSSKCTLILTEGDSAKALAVSGFSVVGRQSYGVFPLRGKPLNVRNASKDQLAKNKETLNIVKILGLRQDVDYRIAKNRASLRYGRLVIMADQDDDGTHIKSLVLNFVAVFNPTLLAIPFLFQFVTPVIRARKGKQVKSFYTRPEYNKWARRITPENLNKWKIKYYKGLGTSSATEAREYFRDLARHLEPFDQVDVAQEYTSLDVLFPSSKKRGASRAREDGGGGGGSKESAEVLDTSTWDGRQWMEMAFDGTLAHLRKQWLSETPVPTEDPPTTQLVRYDEFFQYPYRLFCQLAIVRAIPHVMDGFKESQRKIFWAACNRSNSEVKVEIFAGAVSDVSSYHHGATSLAGAIVGMAQNYTGSNNLNLLQPIGQFGTRIAGGKDSASTRYIFTKLDPVSRAIFPAADDAVLQYHVDEGNAIEPHYYVPVIPMNLVNGTDGISIGWSSRIPTFDPLVLLEVIERYLATDTWDFAPLLVPWTRGFKGTYVAVNVDELKFDTVGIIQMVGTKTLEITELPVGKWTDPYISFARQHTLTKSGNPPDNVINLSTETTVHIQIVLHRDVAAQYAAKQAQLSDADFTALLVKDWKLTSTVWMNPKTAILLDRHGCPKSFTVQDILEVHAAARLDLYETRKRYLLDAYRAEMPVWTRKVRFLQCLLDDTLVVRKRPLADIQASMTDLEFPASTHAELLKLPLSIQTAETVELWTQKLNQIEAAIVKLEAQTAKELWSIDLSVLKTAIEKQNAELAKVD